jgi:hypothetical protein
VSKYLLTQSLISACNYRYSDFGKYGDRAEEYEEKAQADFLSALRRERTPTTEAQQRGIDFEELVVRLAEEKPILSTNFEYDVPAWEMWIDSANQIADVVRGGQFQASLSAPTTVRGVDLLLYGRLDCLKAGIIYDIKFTGSYDYGKFTDSVQHPMYFELVPEADEFTYLVSDGKYTYTETYRRQDTRPAKYIIDDFLATLEREGLMPLYREKWEAL